MTGLAKWSIASAGKGRALVWHSSLMLHPAHMSLPPCP